MKRHAMQSRRITRAQLRQIMSEDAPVHPGDWVCLSGAPNTWFLVVAVGIHPKGFGMCLRGEDDKQRQFQSKLHDPNMKHQLQISQGHELLFPSGTQPIVASASTVTKIDRFFSILEDNGEVSKKPTVDSIRDKPPNRMRDRSSLWLRWSREQNFDHGWTLRWSASLTRRMELSKSQKINLSFLEGVLVEPECTPPESTELNQFVGLRFEEKTYNHDTYLALPSKPLGFGFLDSGWDRYAVEWNNAPRHGLICYENSGSEGHYNISTGKPESQNFEVLLALGPISVFKKKKEMFKDAASTKQILSNMFLPAWWYMFDASDHGNIRHGSVCAKRTHTKGTWVVRSSDAQPASSSESLRCDGLVVGFKYDPNNPKPFYSTKLAKSPSSSIRLKRSEGAKRRQTQASRDTMDLFPILETVSSAMDRAEVEPPRSLKIDLLKHAARWQSMLESRNEKGLGLPSDSSEVQSGLDAEETVKDAWVRVIRETIRTDLVLRSLKIATAFSPGLSVAIKIPQALTRKDEAFTNDLKEVGVATLETMNEQIEFCESLRKRADELNKSFQDTISVLNNKGAKQLFKEASNKQAIKKKETSTTNKVKYSTVTQSSLVDLGLHKTYHAAAATLVERGFKRRKSYARQSGVTEVWVCGVSQRLEVACKAKGWLRKDEDGAEVTFSATTTGEHAPHQIVKEPEADETGDTDLKAPLPNEVKAQIIKLVEENENIKPFALLDGLRKIFHRGSKLGDILRPPIESETLMYESKLKNKLFHVKKNYLLRKQRRMESTYEPLSEPRGTASTSASRATMESINFIDSRQRHADLDTPYFLESGQDAFKRESPTSQVLRLNATMVVPLWVQKLKTLPTYRLAIDATFNTNCERVNRPVVVVIDEARQGHPICMAYADKDDEDSYLMMLTRLHREFKDKYEIDLFNRLTQVNSDMAGQIKKGVRSSLEKQGVTAVLCGSALTPDGTELPLEEYDPEKGHAATAEDVKMGLGPVTSHVVFVGHDWNHNVRDSRGGKVSWFWADSELPKSHAPNLCQVCSDAACVRLTQAEMERDVLQRTLENLRRDRLRCTVTDDHDNNAGSRDKIIEKIDVNIAEVTARLADFDGLLANLKTDKFVLPPLSYAPTMGCRPWTGRDAMISDYESIKKVCLSPSTFAVARSLFCLRWQAIFPHAIEKFQHSRYYGGGDTPAMMGAMYNTGSGEKLNLDLKASLASFNGVAGLKKLKAQSLLQDLRSSHTWAKSAIGKNFAGPVARGILDIERLKRHRMQKLAASFKTAGTFRYEVGTTRKESDDSEMFPGLFEPDPIISANRNSPRSGLVDGLLQKLLADLAEAEGNHATAKERLIEATNRPIDNERSFTESENITYLTSAVLRTEEIYIATKAKIKRVTDQQKEGQLTQPARRRIVVPSQHTRIEYSNVSDTTPDERRRTYERSAFIWASHVLGRTTQYKGFESEMLTAFSQLGRAGLDQYLNFLSQWYVLTEVAHPGEYDLLWECTCVAFKESGACKHAISASIDGGKPTPKPFLNVTLAGRRKRGVSGKNIIGIDKDDETVGCRHKPSSWVQGSIFERVSQFSNKLGDLDPKSVAQEAADNGFHQQTYKPWEMTVKPSTSKLRRKGNKRKSESDRNDSSESSSFKKSKTSHSVSPPPPSVKSAEQINREQADSEKQELLSKILPELPSKGLLEKILAADANQRSQAFAMCLQVWRAAIVNPMHRKSLPPIDTLEDRRQLLSQILGRNDGEKLLQNEDLMLMCIKPEFFDKVPDVVADLALEMADLLVHRGNAFQALSDAKGLHASDTTAKTEYATAACCICNVRKCSERGKLVSLRCTSTECASLAAHATCYAIHNSLTTAQWKYSSPPCPNCNNAVSEYSLMEDADDSESNNKQIEERLLFPIGPESEADLASTSYDLKVRHAALGFFTANEVVDLHMLHDGEIAWLQRICLDQADKILTDQAAKANADPNSLRNYVYMTPPNPVSLMGPVFKRPCRVWHYNKRVRSNDYEYASNVHAGKITFILNLPMKTHWILLWGNKLQNDAALERQSAASEKYYSSKRKSTKKFKPDPEDMPTFLVYNSIADCIDMNWIGIEALRRSYPTQHGRIDPVGYVRIRVLTNVHQQTDSISCGVHCSAAMFLICCGLFDPEDHNLDSDRCLSRLVLGDSHELYNWYLNLIQVAEYNKPSSQLPAMGKNQFGHHSGIMLPPYSLSPKGQPAHPGRESRKRNNLFKDEIYYKADPRTQDFERSYTNKHVRKIETKRCTWDLWDRYATEPDGSVATRPSISVREDVSHDAGSNDAENKQSEIIKITDSDDADSDDSINIDYDGDSD